MFDVLVTEALGAPASVQDRYLIERRLDLATSTEPMLQVRERSTGLRLWLKCTDGTEASAQRINAEFAVLSRLAHPHVQAPLLQPPAAPAPVILYPWQNEEPLHTPLLAGIGAPDRVRISTSLLEAVNYLQALLQPVLHGNLVLENLWIVPGVSWLKLAGFNRSVHNATGDDLQREREAALALAWQICGADIVPAALQEAGQHWASVGAMAFGALNLQLKQLFLEQVTADL